MESSRDPNNRYLSLTGVIIELGYVSAVLYPQMEALKAKYFGSHPDEPLILHRKELLNKRHPFHALRDPAVSVAFDAELLHYLAEWEYTVITITIDKLRHNEQYTVWKYDPYHYCMKLLVERYILWLNNNNCVGDVMAESRAGKEDMRLKASFARVYKEGSEYVTPDKIQKCLTSKELKVKPKHNNISGLQLADLIAHPSYRACVLRHNNEALPDNFGGKVAEILEASKYYRSYSGRLDGWGRKMLP